MPTHPGIRRRTSISSPDSWPLLGGGSPQPAEVTGLTAKNDGNNVDLDREARLLAENAMRFNVASSLMRTQLNTIKEAIQGGKSA